MDCDLGSLRTTLAEVNELITLSEDTAVDLVRLQDDLKKVIALKEAELLEQRKVAALAAVESVIENSVAEVGGTPSVDLLLESGSRCSLPGWTARGIFIYQNALVGEVINETPPKVRLFLVNPTRFSDLPCEDYLTNGSCQRATLCRRSHGVIASVENVQVWQDPDPSLYLKEGQACLALRTSKELGQHQPSVWEHGQIQYTDFEAGTCIVSFSNIGRNKINSGNMPRSSSYSNLDAETVSLPLSHVHPISMEDCLPPYIDEAEPSESLDSSSGESIEVEDDGKLFGFSPRPKLQVEFTLCKELYAAPPDSGASFVFSSSSTEDSEPLGLWEACTRGIGSRLLQQMGYNGKGGLGRRGNGRRLPVSTDEQLHRIVQSEIGSTRPSLDLLVELRADKSDVRRGRHRRQKAKSGRFAKVDRVSKGVSNVFDFINAKLNKEKSPERTTKSICVPKSVRQINIERCELQLRRTAVVQLSEYFLRHLQSSAQQLSYDFPRVFHLAVAHHAFAQPAPLTRKILSVKSRITTTEISLARNQSRDRKAADHARQRIVLLNEELASLANTDASLALQSSKQQGDAKLRIF